MANSYENFIDPLVHAPTDMAHPVLAGAAAAVIIGGTLFARYQMDRTSEQGAIDFRRNGEALRASQIGTERDTNNQRFLPVFTVMAGMSVIALQLIGQPSYDSPVKNQNAETVVVLDASSSMIFTNDIEGSKKSRYGAAVAAVGATKYIGNLGFVETANNSITITKPVKNWREYTADLEKPTVDPNGGQLILALDTAASLTTEDTVTKKHTGTIVVVSDGSVNESSKQITEKLDGLKQDGLRVRVVVPGTAKSKYRLPQTTKDIDSGIKIDTFAGFGKVEGLGAVADLQKAIANELKLAENVGAGHKKNRWPIPSYLGAGILLAGIGQFTKKVIKRY